MVPELLVHVSAAMAPPHRQQNRDMHLSSGHTSDRSNVWRVECGNPNDVQNLETCAPLTRPPSGAMGELLHKNHQNDKENHAHGKCANSLQDYRSLNCARMPSQTHLGKAPAAATKTKMMLNLLNGHHSKMSKIKRRPRTNKQTMRPGHEDVFKLCEIDRFPGQTS